MSKSRPIIETADYDVRGSWGPASEGWPCVNGDDAHAMYVFANCAPSIPYGSYVLMSEKGKYGAKESSLRVDADHITQLLIDFDAAGRPTAEESVRRRGGASRAKKWW